MPLTCYSGVKTVRRQVNSTSTRRRPRLILLRLRAHTIRRLLTSHSMAVITPSAPKVSLVLLYAFALANGSQVLDLVLEVTGTVVKCTVNCRVLTEQHPSLLMARCRRACQVAPEVMVVVTLLHRMSTLHIKHTAMAIKDIRRRMSMC